MKLPPLIVVLTLLVGACAPADENPNADGADPVASTPGTMNVVARGLSFDAPTQIPSGWTTIRLSNQSPMIHFAIVERMPPDHGVAAHQREVAPVFQAGMNLLAAGDVDAALAQFGKLPSWFSEIVFTGGPGLTSPNQVSEATVFLEPGTYLLECYVKTDGLFHSFNPDSTMYGMVHEFTVTDDTTGVGEPTATVRLDISSTDGIQVQGDAVAGTQTIAVHFVDQTVHENFVGHDVHVVQLHDDVDVGELQEWMDWRGAAGLQTPAPVQFLGGINEMPAGTTGYFTVTLSPGRYAWIAEVPDAAGQGMFREFTVR